MTVTFRQASSPQKRVHLKTNKMDHNNNIEVLLFSQTALSRSDQKELMEWLTGTLQSRISQLQSRTKTMVLTVWKNSPAIYLS